MLVECGQHLLRLVINCLRYLFLSLCRSILHVIDLSQYLSTLHLETVTIINHRVNELVCLVLLMHEYLFKSSINLFRLPSESFQLFMETQLLSISSHLKL